MSVVLKKGTEERAQKIDIACKSVRLPKMDMKVSNMEESEDGAGRQRYG